MNLQKTSRSIMLWLIIIFSFTFVKAQQTSNSFANLAKKAEKQSASPIKTEKLSTDANKSRFNKSNFTSTDKNETADAGVYGKQTKKSNREWGMYAGSVAFYKDIKGESQKAPVVLFALRYAWTTKNNPSHRLRYYMDFQPLIIVNYRERRPIQATPTTIVNVGRRRTVFGVGFTPVGLQFNWRNSRKYQPYIAGGFGVALFNRRFPDNRSPLQPDKIGNFFQLNPDFGAGVEIRQSERKSYFIGYKYHHLSNGYTAPLNVGYNTNMIYAGIYFRRGEN